MTDTEEDKLIETLRKVEALYARSTIAGERAAAGNAVERIRERLKAFEQKEQAVEYKFRMADMWSKSLFIALLRRYELRPYRYRGQRWTTVMVRVTRSFVNEVLWPEFEQLNKVLHEHLQSVTHRIISQAIHGDQTDAEERPGNGDGPGQLPFAKE